MQESSNFKIPRHVPLSIRILLVAALNVGILGAVFVLFLRAQLQPEFDSFLMAGARARIASLTTLVTADLVNADATRWNDVLKRYSDRYGLTLLLYRNTGEQLAGPRTLLPAEVDARMLRFGPPPPANGAPFPPPVLRRGPISHLNPPPGPVGPPFLVLTRSKMKYWVGVRMPLIATPEDEPLRSVLMFISPAFFTNPFFFEIKPWLGMAAAVVIISVLCWLPLVRGLTRSIADMMHATGRVSEGRFDVGLRTARHDELGRLAFSINRMAGRLKTLTEGRKRFLGDVAHELRSPIARMRLAVEILERKSPPDTQAHIDDLKEDIELMSQLTDELLQFARAETTHEPVTLVRTNVAEAVQTAIQRESAQGADIRVVVDPSFHVQANTELLIRSLANVLRNAIRYAADRGPIRISANRKNDRIVIRVTDCGPGVPEDSLDKIFAPFYRIDDARDRQSGGTGLGLAIVRTYIEACGGTVECRNRRPSGLEVLLQLLASH
jgi:signal transduction histidine kinase